MKTIGRGTVEEWEFNGQSTQITTIKWYDNRPEHLITAFAKTQPVYSIERYDKRNNKKLAFSNQI